MKYFPCFVVTPTIKDFSIVHEADVDVSLEYPCFLHDPTSVCNLISGSSAFLNLSFFNWKFIVHVLLKPRLKDFFLIIYFNWRLITLQYCSGFCRTLTWISHGCTCVPHPETPPTSLPIPHPLGSSQCTSPEHPVSCIEPGLSIRFTYDSLHVSVPFSHTIPPSPSPTESKKLFNTSVSLLLSWIQGYHYHLSKFHIHALVYCIGVFLSGLLHSV